MIDVDGLRDLFKKCGIYGKESDKNFIIKCPYCGDKTSNSGHQHYHCYVSKDDSLPVTHCFFCNGSWSLSKLLLDLTGEKHEDLLIPVNSKKNYVKKVVEHKNFVLPEIDRLAFPAKSFYMRGRAFNKLDIEDIPNLIFDIREFFRINNLDIFQYIEGFEQEFIQNYMVGFLSRNQTLLYCRSVSNNVPMKFKKITLRQDDSKLDYYCIDNYRRDSNIVVLSEGNFDIIGCYSLNTLNLRDTCRAFCSGCTFSYVQLLRSVCVDFSMYRPDVVILSDSDKQQYHYKKFLYNTKNFVNSVSIYYNSLAKDFGDYPHKPVRLY